MDLTALRARLTGIDEELIGLVAERQRLSKEIALVKRAAGAPTRDFGREREVLLNAHAAAGRLGIPPGMAAELVRLLIRHSLTTQEHAQVVAQGRGSGKRALIIGGRGRMGRWFADFLASQGYGIEIADPAGPVRGYSHVTDWRHSTTPHDVIIMAAPLAIGGRILHELAERRPAGLVIDIGSLKTPLRSGLEALVAAGVRTASIHPMFGPDTELLSGRHVLHIDLGNESAVREGMGLFESTMAEQVVTTLDEHDRLIAFVLGLSHAANIAFFTALAGSQESVPRLSRLSSTTFDAQLDVAARVAADSPALYFEIQSLNRYGAESLEALATAVSQLIKAVESGDAAAFEGMMLRGRTYLEGRTSVRAP